MGDWSYGFFNRTSVLKKRFKRPMNRPLKCFQPKTEQNLKIAGSDYSARQLFRLSDE